MEQVKWYDLGGSDGDAGLKQFKKGFVGKEGAIVGNPPCFNYGANLSARVAGKAIFKARDAKVIATKAAHRVKQMIAA